MRFRHFCVFSALTLSVANGTWLPVQNVGNIKPRQQPGDSGLPTLGVSSTTSPSEQSSATASPTVSDSSASTSKSDPSSLPISTPPSNSTISSAPTSTQSKILATVSDGLSMPPSSMPTAAPNGTSVDGGLVLPLQPEITPAIGISGVFLIISGLAYGLIGVKNKWIHVFLSSAYLASLAVLVLIVYVLNPPVKNAVQGAYFVAVLISGVIFGGGALIFKDITEGLGCLLGGYCLSMWFLTLKSGGLITDSVGKGVFIGVFCVVVWAFSFSRFTRDYTLIFSTSFGGSTSLVLGVDCFSKGGLKEFWIYLWNLNAKLFPLNTTTYPITRGCRVETIVIVLGTIIGIISQIRLWKLVQNKQKAREAEKAEDARRREVVEEAIGRHLERQNDRDRSEWEKRYGNRLESKRNTILWTDAHTEAKRFSSTSTTEVGSSNNSADSVEMTSIPQNGSRHSTYSSKHKGAGHMSVHPIQEVDEEENLSKTYEKLAGGSSRDLRQQPSNERLEADDTNLSLAHETDGSMRAASFETGSQTGLTQSLKPTRSKPPSIKIASRLTMPEVEPTQKKRSPVPSLRDLRRRSMQSLTGSGKSPKSPRSPISPKFAESQEALVKGPDADDKSRASSIAATLDEDNDRVEIPGVDDHLGYKPPTIVVSPAHDFKFFSEDAGLGLHKTTSAQSDNFDNDPEEMVRRPVSQVDAPKQSSNAPEERCSSAASLTRDALDRVPSQMSNVVLSYRTNEWAKHIAAAEAPIFEEPEPFAGDDTEAPTHLAQPASPTLSVPDDNTSKPPPLPSPIGSVAPSDSGVKVNPESQAGNRLSATSSDTAALIVTEEITSRPQSAMSSANRRSFTDPAQSQSQSQSQPQPTVSTMRNISSPQRMNTVQNITIDENEPANFTTSSVITHTPTDVKRISQDPTSFTQQFYQVNTNKQTKSRNTSSSQLVSRNASQTHLSRNMSQTELRNTSTLSMRPGSRSETRLVESGAKTHQPLRRNNTDETSREALLANWRSQLAQSTAENVVPVSRIDHQYARQTQDYSTDKLRKEAERRNKERAQAAKDQGMRTQGMIDAHKEMLKRMQNQANKKL